MVGRIAAWVIGILITALYGYAAVAAVGNLVLLPQMSAEMGASVSGTGWFWLVLGVVLPVVAYGIALLVGRKRSAALRLLVLAAGLCALAAVQLEILHLVPRSSFFVAVG